MTQNALLSALEWHINIGVDEALQDEPVNRTKIIETIEQTTPQKTAPTPASISTGQSSIIGSSQAKDEALALAKAANNLDELQQAIMKFEGLAIKTTASNMVFSAGNPKAPIMLVGDAPKSDEDKEGTVLNGASGKLLDTILNHIGINRSAENPDQSIYLSHILNWRPPGNRTPNTQEIEISLPFIEKHIELIQPKLLILAGPAAAKALLNKTDSMSRLRAKWHDYKPQTSDKKTTNIPTIVTYHPGQLLSTPTQKKQIWQDMLMLQEKRRDLKLI